MKLRNLLAAFAAVIASTAALHGAGEVWVGGPGASDSNDGSSASPFATIAKGVAECDAGGVVHVRAGNYPVAAQIEVTKAVTVLGEDRDTTVVYRQDTSTSAKYRVFYLNNASAVVSGFTITNGYINAGAGVSIGSAGGTLSDCIVAKCEAVGDGGCVYLTSAKKENRFAVVTNCVVENCVSSGWNAPAPGVFMGLGGLLVDSIVRGNTCKTGAYSAYCGVYLNGGEILRCAITGNTSTIKTAPTGGGGIYVHEQGGAIHDSLIAGNGYQFLYAGAIYAANTKGDLTVSGCTITANRGSHCGGIMVASSVTKAVNVIDTILQGNIGDFLWNEHSAEWYGPGFSFTDSVCPVGFGTATATGCVTGYVDFGPDYSLLYSPYGLSAGWKPYDAATAAGNYGFRVDAARKAAGQAFAFSAYGYDPDHATLDYAWAFGDGATASGATATHAYAAPGAYTATLTVSAGGTPLGTFTKELLAASDADAYVVNAALNPGHTPAFPYATPETAATDIQSAIDAVADGRTVHIGPGTYALTAAVSLSNAVAVVATEGRDATRLVRSVNQNAKGIIQRCAYVSHPDARLEGFALSGGLIYWESDTSSYYAASGAGVLVTGLGGTVADCAITNCGFAKAMFVPGCGVGLYSDSAVLTNCLVADNRLNGTRCRGAGINIQAGLIVDCVVSNNYYFSGYTTEGCAIRATGKCRITRSRICDNTASGNQSGVSLMHKEALLDNCLVDGNTASGTGGGVYLDSGNGTIVNCTIVGNTAGTGGGIFANGNTRWALLNTVVQGNTASGDEATWQINGSANGLKQGVASNCASTAAFPFTETAPVACLVTNAAFADDGFTPGTASPLIDAGWNGALPGLADSLDYNGDPRLVAVREARVDIGCVEFQGSPPEAHFSASTLRCVTGYEVSLSGSAFDPAGGSDTVFRWRLDGGEWSAWSSSPTLTTSFATVGDHTVELVARIGGVEIDGGSATVSVRPTDVYAVSPVRNPGWTPSYPYATPQTAATNVLDALDASGDGGRVHVGPGLHIITGELVIDRPIRVFAEDGVAELRRRRSGSSARLVIERVATLDNADASLEGFVISGGYVNDSDSAMASLGANSGAGVRIGGNGGSLLGCTVTNCLTGAYCNGGGVALVGPGLVSNCVFRANQIGGWMTYGGGVYQTAGRVTHCIFHGNVSNSGNGGASSSSALYAGGGTASHCVITNNIGKNPSGYSGGGGALYVGRNAVVDNCLVAGNHSPSSVGGVTASGGFVVNCTIAGNSSKSAPAGFYASLAANVAPPHLQNCIIQDNVLAADGTESEWSYGSTASGVTTAPTFSRCLSPVALLGADNILGTAIFRNSRYLPYQRSPGVNAGSVTGFEDILSGTDLLGRPRIVGRAIDIGAVEAGPQTLVIELR